MPLTAERIDELGGLLEKTINQRLDTGTESGVEHKNTRLASALSPKVDDISNFARFLKQTFCLENLLFWKEACSQHIWPPGKCARAHAQFPARGHPP